MPVEEAAADEVADEVTEVTSTDEVGGVAVS